ncbi:organic cation transporter protein-like [Saccoglossus kowalevskii]
MRLEFDEVLIHLGDFGRYQKLVYSLLCFCMIPSCILILSPAFISADVPHVCKISTELLSKNNATVGMYIPYEMNDNRCQPSSCSRYDLHTRNMNESIDYTTRNNITCKTKWATMACDNGWSFDIANHRSSIATEWELVCDRAWLREVATSMLYIGVLAGTLVVSPLSDRYGRRLCIFIALPCNILFGLCSAFAPSFPLFLVSQLLLGGTFVGIYIITYSYVLEWIGPSCRAFVCNSVVVFYSFAYMALAGLAYLIRDWRQLSLVLCIPQVFMLAYFWCIPESPRWLMSRGDIKEAEVIILKAARVNKADISPLLPKLRQYYEEERNSRLEAERMETKKKHLNFLDLIRTPILRKRCVNIFCHWTSISLVYYGVSLNTSTLPGDEYLLFFLAGVMEVPACFLAIYLVDRFGRTIPLSAFFAIAGVGCIGCQLFPEDLNYLSIGVAMIGKLGASAAFWTAYMHTSELLPTVLRTTGLGAASCFGRLGSILAPFVQLLSSTWKPLPFIIYGCVSFAAGAMILLLPETKGQPLPNTIEDIEYSSGSKSDVTSTFEEKDGKRVMWLSLVDLNYTSDVENMKPTIL